VTIDGDVAGPAAPDLTAVLATRPPADFITPERFQKEVVRSTFLMSQGRQWLQISCLDALFRMLLAQGVRIDWDAMGSSEARATMRRRRLPPGHVPVGTPGQIATVFELWLQVALWVGQYVYRRDASWLPGDDRLDRFVHDELGLEPWTSSGTEEEIAGMKTMFGRYRRRDPEARLTTDQAIREFLIPFWVKGDRHWVSGERRRPGVLADPHGSMILHLVRGARAKQAMGWQLTAAEQLCLRVGDVLVEVERVDPGFTTLPTYRTLVEEYNRRHPGSEREYLHR
jgi:hypothetical protein